MAEPYPESALIATRSRLNGGIQTRPSFQSPKIVDFFQAEMVRAGLWLFQRNTASGSVNLRRNQPLKHLQGTKLAGHKSNSTRSIPGASDNIYYVVTASGCRWPQVELSRPWGFNQAF